MKKHPFISGAAMLLLLLFLAGCSKSVDQTVEEPLLAGKLKKPSLFAPVLCQIKELEVTDYYMYHHKFFYNKYGNPDSIIHNDVGTGYPNRIFRYNVSQQLTDYIGPYENGWFEFWRRYYRDSTGRVVRDTTYIFGQMGTDPTNYMYKRLNVYQYDVQDRISQVTETWIGVPIPPIVTNYSYDANGNLITGATYDNMKSAHSTHPVWQFIARDYSVNNPFTATVYFGNLPGLVQTGGAQYRFLDIWYNAEAVYNWTCK